MSDPIASILDRQAALVIDGALATELERRGCDIRGELWSARVLLEQPELIRRLHLDYFEAGADCAISASYQATIPGFMRRGMSEPEAIGLIRRSVQLAAAARDEFWSQAANRAGRCRPLVAASVGPYGAYLADGSEYTGNYALGRDELMDFHRPRLRALVESGPDLLACETIPSCAEAEALAALLGEFPSVPAWFSFSARDGSRISEGRPFADCLRLLAGHPQVVAVGVNCTSPRYVPSLIREAKRHTRKPILVYPNLGESYNAASNEWSGGPVCRSFGDEARFWYDAGARLIGGCCRTTPEDIRAIADWVRELKPGPTAGA
jgi:homocysteine S-methyltransferase